MTSSQIFWQKINSYREPITLMIFVIYDKNTLPEQYTNVKISFLAPFTFKSSDFYEIISVKGAEKRQWVSITGLRNMQSSLHNSAKLDDICVMETDCLFLRPVTETDCLFLKPVTDTHCRFFNTLYSDIFMSICYFRCERGPKQTFCLVSSVQEGDLIKTLYIKIWINAKVSF